MTQGKMVRGKPTPMRVRFMTLAGTAFETEREGAFATLAEAKTAVTEHATSGGYTGVRFIDDGDWLDEIRCVATTPGGRAGRNIAWITDDSDAEEV